jgi:hypothetical protein
MLSNNQLTEKSPNNKLQTHSFEYSRYNQQNLSESNSNDSSKMSIHKIKNIEDHEVKIYKHRIENKNQKIGALKNFLKSPINKPIPVKIQNSKNFFVFGFFEIDTPRLDFKLVISNYEGKSKTLDANKLELKIKPPGMYKFPELADFCITELSDGLLIFLVVYSYVCIIKFNSVFEEEILFRKDFYTNTPLKLLKSELVKANSEYCYYLYNREDGKIFHLITYDMKNSNGVSCMDKDISFLLMNNNIQAVDKFTVLNGLFYFNDSTNTFYNINIRINKVLKLAAFPNDIRLNSYHMFNKSEMFKGITTKDQVYVLRDEMGSENILSLSLYKLGIGECELVQSIGIKNDGQKIGEYKLSLIEGTEFVAITLYENDLVYLFRFKLQTNTLEGLVFIEEIYCFEFNELNAWLMGYYVNNDNVLILSCQNEFEKFEIDLKTLSQANSLKSESYPNTPTSHYVTPFTSESNKVNNKVVNNNMNKEGIANGIMNALEDKLNEFINKKMNKFSDDLNTKLSDTLSFFKKQSEDLEENRKRNNETINKLIALIGNKNTVPNNLNIPMNIPMRPAIPFIRQWYPTAPDMNNKFNSLPFQIPLNNLKPKQVSPKKAKKIKPDLENMIFEDALLDRDISKIEPVLNEDEKACSSDGKL